MSVVILRHVLRLYLSSFKSLQLYSKILWHQFKPKIDIKKKNSFSVGCKIVEIVRREQKKSEDKCNFVICAKIIIIIITCIK